MATSHPFPTLWPARDGGSSLIQLLDDEDEIYTSLAAYENSAQASSFAPMPEKCSTKEVERFLSNVDHNALIHPDVLALLFAILAQGRRIALEGGQQHIPEGGQPESKKSDVLSENT